MQEESTTPSGPIEIDSTPAKEFLEAAMDLLSDPKTPQAMHETLVALLDSHADLFISLIKG